MVDAIPPAHAGRVIPYLLIDGASDAIDFYAKAFGAVETYRMAMPDGSIAHAEINVGGAAIYLADAPEGLPEQVGSPRGLKGTSVLIHRYVADVDEAVRQAEAAGATVTRPPEDQFYGDRAATVVDPFGHVWSLHTHIRDVTEEEMRQAVEQMGG